MISDDGMYVVFPRFDEYWLHIMGRDFDYPYRRVDPLLTEGVYEQTWQVAVDNRDDIKLIVLYAWNEHKEHASHRAGQGRLTCELRRVSGGEDCCLLSPIFGREAYRCL